MTNEVSINCSRIRNWSSFHNEFERVFGFPAFYGKSMDAWIDCMTSIDQPEDGMSTVHCSLGTILTIRLSNVRLLRFRCPEQLEALIHCTDFVNARRVEVGEAPVLALAYS